MSSCPQKIRIPTTTFRRHLWNRASDRDILEPQRAQGRAMWFLVHHCSDRVQVVWGLQDCVFSERIESLSRSLWHLRRVEIWNNCQSYKPYWWQLWAVLQYALSWGRPCPWSIPVPSTAFWADSQFEDANEWLAYCLNTYCYHFLHVAYGFIFNEQKFQTFGSVQFRLQFIEIFVSPPFYANLC